MSSPILVNLPWPDSDLSPNARTHWRSIAQARSVQRQNARWATLEAYDSSTRSRVYDIRKAFEHAHKLSVSLTFCPPDKRRRDADNVLASLKGALDGISDALGIDDSKFSISYEWGPVRKGGEILVRIEVVNP